MVPPLLLDDPLSITPLPLDEPVCAVEPASGPGDAAVPLHAARA